MGHRASTKTQRHHHLASHPPPASRFRSREEIKTPPSHHRTWRCVCVCCHHGSLPNSHFCPHVQSMCVCICACARAYVCVRGRAGGQAGGHVCASARVFVYIVPCVCMRANTSAHVHTTVRYTQTAAHTRPRDIHKYTHTCIVSVHVGSQSMLHKSARET